MLVFFFLSNYIFKTAVSKVFLGTCNLVNEIPEMIKLNRVMEKKNENFRTQEKKGVEGSLEATILIDKVTAYIKITFLAILFEQVPVKLILPTSQALKVTNLGQYCELDLDLRSMKSNVPISSVHLLSLYFPSYTYTIFPILIQGNLHVFPICKPHQPIGRGIIP